MFAKNFTISDLERLGPVIEQLLNSGKLTEDEWWAVDISARAATDLASIRHSDVAHEFYSRPEIEERTSVTVGSWLADHPDAPAGTVVSICGRMNVASVGSDGQLQLTPILEL